MRATAGSTLERRSARFSTPPAPAADPKAPASPTATSGSARSPRRSTSAITRRRLAGGDAAVPRRRTLDPVSRRHRRDSRSSCMTDSIPKRAGAPSMAAPPSSPSSRPCSSACSSSRADAPWPPTSALRPARRQRRARQTHRRVPASRHPRCPDVRAHRGHVASHHAAPDAAPHKPASSGLPLPSPRSGSAGSDGVAAAGEVGEIEIRGPTLFAGYLGDRMPHRDARPTAGFAPAMSGYLDDDGISTWSIAGTI